MYILESDACRLTAYVLHSYIGNNACKIYVWRLSYLCLYVNMYVLEYCIFHTHIANYMRAAVNA